jgi:hypothetical protein
VLDRFSEKGVERRIFQLADQKFDSCLAQLEEIRLVNVSVDSGTIHSLTVVHCLVSNPFLFLRAVLFDLCESLHETKEDCSGLSKSIVMIDGKTEIHRISRSESDTSCNQCLSH